MVAIYTVEISCCDVVGASLDSANQGMQDLVRFKFTLAAVATKHAWVHFRMLNPTWLSN